MEAGELFLRTFQAGLVAVVLVQFARLILGRQDCDRLLVAMGLLLLVTSVDNTESGKDFVGHYSELLFVLGLPMAVAGGLRLARRGEFMIRITLRS